MLPTRAMFKSFIDRERIRHQDQVLVYTHRDSFAAPRVWWTFRLFGFNAFVLDGGLEAWAHAGGERTDKAPVIIPVTHFTSESPEIDRRLVKDLDEMRELMNSSSDLIVDARSAGRFTGKDPEPRPGLARGHIPGSLNVPFTDLLEPNDLSKFKSVHELAAVFKNHGVDLSKKTITSTCGSGVTACVLTLAMAELGRDIAKTPVYDGSWAEWGKKEDTPKDSLVWNLLSSELISWNLSNSI
jgi:thiosulfate/3-mercaptopyruvate sulfurtransferase